MQTLNATDVAEVSGGKFAVTDPILPDPPVRKPFHPIVTIDP